MYLPTINSFIRFLHASPGAPEVDIYTDGNLMVQNLDYNTVSEYLPVGPEIMRIQVFPAGENSNPVLDTEYSIPPSERITLAIIGTLPDLTLLPILMGIGTTDNDDSFVRFANLSPDDARFDLSIADGAGLFNDIGYTELTDYVRIAPDTYTFQIRMAGSDEVLATSKPILFNPRFAYTIYAIGYLKDEPLLEIGFYDDQVPFIGNKVERKTEFRKMSSSTDKPPRITFIYS
ncbi:hypothetical protein ASZ90_017737 [hydrocarbon metagenome]|uniref:DUF4397 domain-containing protein n=1 Tax=hydrocarbon metagenome TaxID=938273 RepID=A0A0W8E8H3_9ZZZZ